MTSIGKIASVAAALVGGKMLMDSKDYETSISHYKETNLIQDVYNEKELGGQVTYSPYEWPSRFRNFIQDPTNFLDLRRSLIYIKGTLGHIWDNIVPIGLMTTGLIYGLGSSYSRILSGGGKVAGPAFKGVSKLLECFGISALHTVGSAAKTVLSHIHLPSTITTRGAMVTTALAGSVMWIMKVLNDEFTGVNSEKFAKNIFLDPPEE